MFDKLSDWYKANDPHSQHERHVVVAITMVIFLSTIGFVEYWRYFRVWGPSRVTASAFNQNYAEIADIINKSPTNLKKYVIVNTTGTLVNGIPVPSQTVMFLTDTFTPVKQKEKNIYYLTPGQFKKGGYDRRDLVFRLEK